MSRTAPGLARSISVVFDLIDRDGDGSLSRKELMRALATDLPTPELLRAALACAAPVIEQLRACAGRADHKHKAALAADEVKAARKGLIEHLRAIADRVAEAALPGCDDAVRFAEDLLLHARRPDGPVARTAAPKRKAGGR